MNQHEMEKVLAGQRADQILAMVNECPPEEVLGVTYGLVYLIQAFSQDHIKKTLSAEADPDIEAADVHRAMSQRAFDMMQYFTIYSAAITQLFNREYPGIMEGGPEDYPFYDIWTDAVRDEFQKAHDQAYGEHHHGE